MRTTDRRLAAFAAAVPLWLLLAGWTGSAQAAPPTQTWNVTFTRTMNGHEVYVGGFTNTTTGVTYVMYQEDQVEYRVRRYNGIGALLGDTLLEDTDVEFVGFTVDLAGNYIAAGTLTQPGGATDLAAVAFSPAGVLLWETPYDSGYDETASGVAVDPMGNVFIAATYDNSSGGTPDAELVSFDNGGVFRWASTFDSGFPDSGVAVAADGAGNSYLTGQTIDASFADVAYIQACDPAGAILFTRTYAGAAGLTMGFEVGRAITWSPFDDAVYLAADAAYAMDVFRVDRTTGDVLASGTTAPTFTSYQLVGSIGVDPVGGVVVTGVTGSTAGTNFDVLIQSFGPTLVAGWKKTFDRGQFDALSSTSATDHFAATSAAIGVTGSAFVSSALTQPSCFSQGDLLAGEWGPTGLTAWTAVYDGPSYDFAVGVEADAPGDAYVGAMTSGEPSLIKFAGTSGALAWSRFPTFPGLCVYDAGGLAAGSGATYLSYAAQSLVTGDSYGFVGSFSAAGVSGTTYVFSLISPSTDGPVAVDGAGNVYMAGSFASTTTFEDDLYVVKWDPLGTVTWTLTLNAAVADNPAGIVVDAGDNTYVLESTPGTGAAGDAHLLIKVDALGNVAWTRTFSANPLMAENGLSLSLNAGMIVVAGTEDDPVTGASASQIWRLDTAGNVVWVTGTPGSPEAMVGGVRADPFGRIFAAGATGMASPVAWDQQLTSLDAAGASRWNLTFDSGRPIDIGSAVAFRSPNEVFMAGETSSDIRLIKYTEPPQAALAAWLSVTPDATSPNQWVQVVLTVTNGGNATVTGLSPALQLVAGFGLTSQIGGPAPVPPGPVTLAAGAVTAFTWTFSASGAGLVVFSATAAGTDSATASPIAASSSATLLIGARAALVGTVRLVPPSTSIYLGQVFSYELTVTNTGGIPALNVIPRLAAVAGSGTMATVSGPVPAGPLDLGAGSATTFVWTFTVTGVGPLTTTVYAIGWDGLSATLMAGARLTVTFYRAGELLATIQTSPAAAVTVGLPLTVYMTVSNTGQVPVSGVLADLSDDMATGFLSPVSGPVPAGPVTLPGGGSIRFTWTYNTVGSGAVEFSGTATGLDTGLAVPVSATCLGAEVINAGSTLLAEWTLSATTVQQGKTFTEKFSVSNTGGTAAWYVTPSSSVLVASAWRAVQTAGPSPASRALLQPGESVNFIYTFRATATGYIDLTATVTGQDSATLALLAPVGAASSTILILADAILRAAAAVTPATLRVGYPFVFTLTVTNTGSADAVDVIPTLTTDAAALARVDTGPAPAAGGTIAAGASVTYTWGLTSLEAGTLVLTGAVSATDAGTANAAQITRSAAATLVIAPHPDGEIAVYPNPVGTGTLHVYLHMSVPATRVLLDVYDASMRRVYTGEWGTVSDLDGTLDIAGVDKWAPGIYLVRAVATFVDRSTRTYPVAKVKVQR